MGACCFHPETVMARGRSAARQSAANAPRWAGERSHRSSSCRADPKGPGATESLLVKGETRGRFRPGLEIARQILQTDLVTADPNGGLILTIRLNSPCSVKLLDVARSRESFRTNQSHDRRTCPRAAWRENRSDSRRRPVQYLVESSGKPQPDEDQPILPSLGNSAGGHRTADRAGGRRNDNTTTLAGRRLGFTGHAAPALCRGRRWCFGLPEPTNDRVGEKLHGGQVGLLAFAVSPGFQIVLARRSAFLRWKPARYGRTRAPQRGRCGGSITLSPNWFRKSRGAQYRLSRVLIRRSPLRFSTREFCLRSPTIQDSCLRRRETCRKVRCSVILHDHPLLTQNQKR